jgi:CubicO group peptidase (beta-lactamase class C family)
VTERILAPLDMTSTAITLDASIRARLAPGHGQNGNVVPNWHLPTLAGAGALRSTVEDMHVIGSSAGAMTGTASSIPRRSRTGIRGGARTAVAARKTGKTSRS